MDQIKKKSDHNNLRNFFFLQMEQTMKLNSQLIKYNKTKQNKKKEPKQLALVNSSQHDKFVI